MSVEGIGDLVTRLETGRLVSRLLELPALIGGLARQMTALRAERRTLERRARELWARALLAAQGRTAQEREAEALLALEGDPEYRRIQGRLEQIAAALDRLGAEKEELEHERKAIYGAVVARHTEVLERALAERLIQPHGLPSGRKGN